MRPIIKITPLQQLRHLQSSPIGGDGFCKMGTVEWVCKVRPSVLGREYTIKIIYKQGDKPRVRVINPKLLELAGNQNLPHVYPKNELCLFMPATGEWNDRSYIAETIVPWTILWLFYFEHWLITGDWQGGGRHPQKRYKWGVK
jgi:hypothetical protein